VRFRVRCQRLLGSICFLMLATCVKHLDTPQATVRQPAVGASGPLVKVLPRPIDAAPGAPRRSVSENGTTATNRPTVPGPASKSSRATLLVPPDAPPIGRFTVNVPVNGVGTAPRIDLEAIAREALNALPAAELLFKCPSEMRTGSTEEARLTTPRSFYDRFRNQLESRGIPASQTDAISTLVAADLTSPSKDAFDIQSHPAGGPSSDQWIWSVKALNPGNHHLDLKVTLSARIPYAADVQARPVVFSRPVSVTGGENFLLQYRREIAGSLAALLGVSIAWALWRNRRLSVFSHR
jgi:hypothetical protein